MSYLKVLFLFLFISSLNPVKAQNADSGSALVFVNVNAELYIDGIKQYDVVKDIPKKLLLREGEYYIQAINNELEFNYGEMVKITSGKNQIVKLEFTQPFETSSINVADINFLAPGIATVAAGGLMTKKFHYALAKDDTLVLNISMSNKKGTNTIRVSTYPDNVTKFEDLSFQELNDLKLKIESTGIYRIEIGSNHLFDRTCFLKVDRVPASQEFVDFNTEVKEVKDYRVETVIAQEHIWLNSTTNIDGAGRPKSVIPIILPNGTEKWYYSISASRNKEDIKARTEKYDLVKQISSLLGTYGGLLNFGIDMITQPPGSDYVDVNLITHSNYNGFLLGGAYKYLTAGTRLNVKSAVIELPCCFDEPIYLGLENHDTKHGIDVFIEAAALIPETKYVMADQ